MGLASLVLLSVLADQNAATPLCEIFVLPGCPIANAYSPEIERLANQFKGKVRFELIFVDASMSPAEARKHMNDFRLSMPAFVDREGSRRLRSKATHSPEAVVTSNTGRVLYRGRIDDRYASLGVRRPEPRSRDLKDALQAIASGKEPKVSKTAVVGCILPATS